MKSAPKISIFFIFLFLLMPFQEAAAASINTCADCHADEALIKSLFKPPVLPKSEGEG